MHFKSSLGLILFVVSAYASPLVPRNVTRRAAKATSDGQAGAYILAGSGVKYTEAAGTVAMPSLSNAATGTLVSYWVGLDGIDEGSNNEAIVIQAGFDAKKNSDGSVTYSPFYEWYPNPQTVISASDFSVEAGEVVDIIISQSVESAIATFLSTTNGDKKYSVTFYSPGEEYDANGHSAQWVVEQAPGTTLANFGQLDFTACSAAAGPDVYYLDTAVELDLVSDGKTLATGTINGKMEVDILYTGS